MKILNTRKINERILKLVDNDELNRTINNVITAPVTCGEIVFDGEELENNAAMSQRGAKEHGLDFSFDKSLLLTMIGAVIRNTTMVSDPRDVIQEAVVFDIAEEGRIFHKDEFENNAYFKNISFDNQRNGRFELTHSVYDKYELFMYNIPAVKDGIFLPRIGAFDRKFKFPCIKEDGRTWMSISPNEILTMKKAVEEARGEVLTLGLGMGYYAFMVAEKDEVEHVTIIEREQEVIDLFENCILPQFSHPEKITVIKADAFEYLKALNDGKYDYCFADIWIGCLEVESYLTAKKLCKRFKTMRAEYWIEEALSATIVQYVFSVIIMHFCENLGIPRVNLRAPSEDEVSGFKCVQSILENVEITRPEHIDYYMDFKNIIELM